MGVMRWMTDGLVNALTGAGNGTDPRVHNRYGHRQLSDPEIDAAFRGSWLYRKIVSKPAAEMVREWRDWQADKPTIAALEAEEKRLQVQAKCEQALILAGLGGAGMVIYTADADQMAPLDPARIRKDGIVALHVWHRSCFTLGPMIEAWDSSWFGQPSYYELRLNGTPLRLHPSRVIAFRGQPTSGVSTGAWTDWWWGDSVIQVVKDAVDNVHTAEDGFARLIRQAYLRRLSVPRLFEKLLAPNGEANLRKRVDALAAGESSLGVTWLDGGDGSGPTSPTGGAETITDRQMAWAGMPEIKASYLATAAAAANMPATVLLGKSPDGMNATGAGDLTIWEQEVKSRQDLRLRPCLDQLDVALVPSALGAPNADVWWKYAPLSTPTEAVEATTFWNTMQGLNILTTSGLVPDVALEKSVQNLLSERGWLPGIDDALADLPEDERFPSLGQPDDSTDPNALTQQPDPTNVVQLRRAANDALTAAGVQAAAIAAMLDAAFPTDAE